MPAIASDRLVDLHNDLTLYDTTIAQELREFLRGNAVNRSRLLVDEELEEMLRAFKAETPAEMECRRDMLRYKRRIDDVVGELLHMIEGGSTSRRSVRTPREKKRAAERNKAETETS
ncbi:MAG: hypothetical protein BroJett021_01880 [Chloroflexota bacterium]|nr:hypothetical protein [Caldilinea sp.]GIK71200.1 MAG: hypothetical protein BroJett021_01880 [Chloroflexota bacterium]